MEEQLLTGKTALITGGTGGIGRPTALALARLGATTVLVGRDPVRGEAARRFVAEASGSSRVHLYRRTSPRWSRSICWPHGSPSSTGTSICSSTPPVPSNAGGDSRPMASS
jgi:hypothetical protein